MKTYNLQTLNGAFLFTGILEGISYLLLLGVAMPLKYFAGKPLAVEITGMAHGLLFVAFVLLLVMVMIKEKWSIGKGLIAFISSLLPFGPFFLERLFRKSAVRQSSQ